MPNASPNLVSGNDVLRHTGLTIDDLEDAMAEELLMGLDSRKGRYYYLREIRRLCRDLDIDDDLTFAPHSDRRDSRRRDDDDEDLIDDESDDPDDDDYEE